MVVVHVSNGSTSSGMRVLGRCGNSGRLVVQKAKGSSLSGVVVICGRALTMGGCGERVQKRRESSSSLEVVVMMVVSEVVVGSVCGLTSAMGLGGETVQELIGASAVVSGVVLESSMILSVVVGGERVKKLPTEVMKSTTDGRGGFMGVVGEGVV